MLTEDCIAPAAVGLPASSLPATLSEDSAGGLDPGPALGAAETHRAAADLADERAPLVEDGGQNAVRAIQFGSGERGAPG